MPKANGKRAERRIRRDSEIHSIEDTLTQSNSDYDTASVNPAQQGSSRNTVSLASGISVPYTNQSNNGKVTRSEIIQTCDMDYGNRHSPKGRDAPPNDHNRSNSPTDIMGTGDIAAQMVTMMKGVQDAMKEVTSTVRSLVNNVPLAANQEPEPQHPAYGGHQGSVANCNLRMERGWNHQENGNFEEDPDSDAEVDLFRRPPSQQSSRTNGSNGMKLPVFTGREKWDVWFNRFTAVADRKRWSNEERLDEMLPRLQEAAGEFVFGQLPRRVLGNYRYLVRELDSRYKVVETPRTYGVQFSRRSQKMGETVEEYAAELKRLYDKAYAHRDWSTRQEDLLRRFLDGLHDEQARFQVEYVKEPEDIDQAVYQVVHFLETRTDRASNNTSDSRFRRPTRLVKTDEWSYSDEDEEVLPAEEDRALRVPNKPGLRQKSAQHDHFRAAEAKEVIKSETKPDMVDHSDSDIMKKILDRLTKLEDNKQLSNTGASHKPEPAFGRQRQEDIQSRTCFICHQPNHFARLCPERIRNQQLSHTPQQYYPSPNYQTRWDQATYQMPNGNSAYPSPTPETANSLNWQGLS